MPLSHLDDRALLRLSGEDTIAFLQGLITSDARKLTHGEPLYACLLSPQGKFLHDFFIAPHQGSYWLDVDRAGALNLKKRLMLYRLRSKVDIEAIDIQVIAGWNETVPSGEVVFRDPRYPHMGWRAYGASQSLQASAMIGDYHAHRISLGIPDGARDLIAEKSFLLEWGIDQLHGVDYQKGCYVGQEVTARTHYRGQVKKAPYMVSADHPLPAAGTPIYCGEKEAGELRSSSQNQGLALLRLEEVEASHASGMPLRAGDNVLSVRQPDWFTLPNK